MPLSTPKHQYSSEDSMKPYDITVCCPLVGRKDDVNNKILRAISQTKWTVCYLVTYLVFIMVVPVQAENLQEVQKKSLNTIDDFATQICGSETSLQGINQKLELSGTAKVEFAALLKKLTSIGAKGAARYTSERYQGPLQADIANIISKRADCKLKVFTLLNNKLVPTAKVKKTAKTKNIATGTSQGLTQNSYGANSPNIANVQDNVEVHIQNGAPTTNIKYLSTLIGKEPFAEQLPEPLVAYGFESFMTKEANASKKISAVQLNVKPDPTIKDQEGAYSDLQVFAQIELYKSVEDASSRSRSQKTLLSKIHDTGLEPMSDDSFCVLGDIGMYGAWICGGTRGFVYVEVTVSPGVNAFQGITTGTVSALLNYADKVTALATNK